MATFSAGIYKNGILLGTGTVDSAATTVTSYSGTAPANGRNIQVQMRSGNNVGRHYNARVLSGSGTATLTLDRKCDFA